MLSRHDRENLHLATSDDVRPGPTSPSCTARSRLGAAPDRQLRLADRDGGRLAGDHPRRRADAAVRHRRLAAGPRRSAAVIGQLREPLLDPEDAARRLRPERRLLVRRDAQRRRPGAPLRPLRRARSASPSSRSRPARGATRVRGRRSRRAPRRKRSPSSARTRASISTSLSSPSAVSVSASASASDESRTTALTRGTRSGSIETAPRRPSPCRIQVISGSPAIWPQIRPGSRRRWRRRPSPSGRAARPGAAG